MTLRPRILFLVSLLLSAGFVFAQESPPAPPTPPTPPAFGQNFTFFLDGGSFLGVQAEDIDNEKAGRYGLRNARGVGITSVVKDSPAEKAGLRKDDVILRFDGENVTSVRKLNRLVSEVAPDQTVRLGISRAGSEQEVAVTIGKRKNTFAGNFDHFKNFPNTQVWGTGDRDFTWTIGNNRRIGVSTTTLTKQLADYFGIADGQGVLVTSVSEDSPAAKAGIKAGDVITAVDGEKIDSSGDLSRAINKKKEGDVTLTVIRNKHQQNFTLTPKESSSTIFSQEGQRVVIPRIRIPAVPEINISMPSIQIPVIPPITIDVDLSDKIMRKLERRANRTI
jgi:serine protease Do